MKNVLRMALKEGRVQRQTGRVASKRSQKERKCIHKKRILNTQEDGRRVESYCIKVRSRNHIRKN